MDCVEILIVDCCPMWVMDWSNRLRYSLFCIRSSACVCFGNKPRSTTDSTTSAVAIAMIFFIFFFLFIFHQEDIGPCLPPSEGTPIIISAWYTSDVFPVSVFWTGERKWLGAVFIQLKINATFFCKKGTRTLTHYIKIHVLAKKSFSTRASVRRASFSRS